MQAACFSSQYWILKFTRNGNFKLQHCGTSLRRQCKDYAQQIRACYNCLRPYSKLHICSKNACHVCNRQHHILLHVNAQNSSASDRRPITNHNPSANERNSATAEVNTYCSLKSKPTNHVLLVTAMVEVKNKYNQYVPCRVLLDSASQLNFISEKCVQRLRLPRTQTPVSTQEVNKVNTTHQCFTSLEVKADRLAYNCQLCSVTTHHEQHSSIQIGYKHMEDTKEY